MSKDQHNDQDFDRIFREKLGGHSVAPPAGMWEKINTNTQASKRKRGLFLIIINDTAIMLLIILLSFFGIAEPGILNTNTGNDTHTANAFSEPSSQETISKEAQIGVSVKPTDQVSSEGLTKKLEDPESEPSKLNIKENTRSKEDKQSPEEFSKTLSSNASNSGKTPLPVPDRNTYSDENENGQADEKSDSGPMTADNSMSPKISLGGNTKIDSKPSVEPIKDFTESSVELNKPPFKLHLIEAIEPALSYEAADDDSLKKLIVPEAPKDLVGSRDHEVFAGAHVNFNLPLIFNQNTYGAFDGKELAYKPTFGLASGVRIGYTYKRQYGFQTGFIFYSRQGQDYDDNLNGFAAKRQVKLQYMQVPIVLRYKFKIKKQQKFESPWVVNLGTQIGILQSAQITYNGNEYPLGAISNPEANDKDYFKPIDVSVVLGVEKEIYFTKWLMLSVGMRTTFSGDINAKDHPVENDGKNYDKSHNFTFGFTLGLNYYLRR